MTPQTCCSFCMKSAKDVSHLIAGPGIYVCDECVGRCVAVLQQAPPPGESSVVVLWEALSDEEMLRRLPRMVAVADQVETGTQAWVSELRRRSVTWSRIGEALGMTRQSAWGRFSGDE